MQASTTPPSPDDLLSPEEVSARLRVSKRTLANWRYADRGPRYVKLGKRAVRYRHSDVAAFIDGTTGAGTGH